MATGRFMCANVYAARAPGQKLATPKTTLRQKSKFVAPLSFPKLEPLQLAEPRQTALSHSAGRPLDLNNAKKTRALSIRDWSILTNNSGFNYRELHNIPRRILVNIDQ